MHRIALLILFCLVSSCSDEPAVGPSPDTEDPQPLQDMRERDLSPSDDGTADSDSRDLPDGDDLLDLDLGVDSQPDAPEDTADDTSTDTPDDQDDAGETGDLIDEEVIDCPSDRPAYVSVHVRDFNLAPLQVNDRLEVTFQITALGTSSHPGWLWADLGNIEVLEGTIKRDGAPFSDYQLVGQRFEASLPSWEEATYTLEGTVQNNWQLVSVRSGLAVGYRDCDVARSRSGALLQVIGGESKTPFCLDMAEFRSVQLAAEIPLQDTSSYRELNGQREDIWADHFIFCPQHLTIVHETEFCLTRRPEQSVTLSGSFTGDSTWEVDDFALVEVLESSQLLADGCTTQTHPGDSNFWCEDTGTNPCPTPDGCQAELTVIDEVRVIQPLAVTSAVGDCPRCFQDGAVAIDPLLPADGHAVDVRITALDMEIQGRLQPALYILSSDPE
ncbi:MAG: hypothetical protein JW797_12640 [Bradymonadales bacterium]|nr:hypothetical protein [Bradymonadales bacterium]